MGGGGNGGSAGRDWRTRLRCRFRRLTMAVLSSLLFFPVLHFAEPATPPLLRWDGRLCGRALGHAAAAAADGDSRQILSGRSSPPPPPSALAWGNIRRWMRPGPAATPPSASAPRVKVTNTASPQWPPPPPHLFPVKTSDRKTGGETAGCFLDTVSFMSHLFGFEFPFFSP